MYRSKQVFIADSLPKMDKCDICYITKSDFVIDISGKLIKIFTGKRLSHYCRALSLEIKIWVLTKK